ncbi:DUF2795 domain-containing protein, partial [Mycobacterium sp. E342]|uniref:DUF2795 domain-containing protein n=1 Tax=Mycobacterium sp. E342 TaxID=1834147 RepID=UPI0012EA1532
MVASTTPSQLRQCLNDVDFPANKQDLLEAAGRNGCNDDTIRAMRAIPPETYNNAAQVAASVTIADEHDVRDGDKAAARRSQEPRFSPSSSTIGLWTGMSFPFSASPGLVWERRAAALSPSRTSCSSAMVTDAATWAA